MSIGTVSLYPQALWNSVVETSQAAKNASYRVLKAYNHNSAFVCQVSTLALTACVFASKVFSSMPKVLPRLSLSMLNYVGIIYIDSQIMHLCKSIRDIKLAASHGDTSGIFMLSLKIYVKAADVFLTVANFGFSLVALGGFPQVTVIANLALRPISIVGWLLGSLNSTIDYYRNIFMLERFQGLKALEPSDYQNSVTLIVNNILQIIEPEGEARLAFRPEDTRTHRSEDLQLLALLTVRQLEESSLREFSDNLLRNLNEDPNFLMDWEKNLRYFKGMKRRIKEKNHQMMRTTVITGLGWVSLVVGKFYPDSLSDWGLRFSISLLYTAKMAWKKYTLSQLATDIE